jgi:hypothetical protein
MTSIPSPNSFLKKSNRTIEIPASDIHLYRDGKILETRVTYETQTIDIDRPIYIDHIIEKEIPHYIENIVESVVRREVPHHVETIIDVPIYVDNIIYHDNHRDVPYYTEIEVDSGHVHRQPIHRERIIEQECRVERQVVQTIEKEVITHVERPIHRVHEIIQEVW